MCSECGTDTISNKKCVISNRHQNIDILGKPGQDDDDLQSWLEGGSSKPRSSPARKGTTHRGDVERQEAGGEGLADWFEDRVERPLKTPPQQPSSAQAHVQPPHTHASPAATAQAGLVGLDEEYDARCGRPAARDSLIDFGTASENGVSNATGGYSSGGNAAPLLYSSDVDVDDLLGLDMQEESSLGGATQRGLLDQQPMERANGSDAFVEEHLQMFGGSDDAGAGSEEWDVDNVCEAELEDSLGELRLQGKGGCEAHRVWV